MKTLAISQLATAISSTHRHPVFWRFAWKEFRMLYGFWLAVGGLAVAQQAISLVIRAPVTNAAAILFASALGAAALYAAGAAAMLFAVEHEENTFSFLSTLPTTWLPVFAGKLLVATVSAFALAGTLCLTGRLLAGGWPATHVAVAFTSLFGIAIFEALTWGTFFSLRLKRPLMAALLAICTATLVVQLLVLLGADSVNPSWMVESYQAAIPWRLFIVVVVLIADVLLARSWWPVPSSDPAGGTAGHVSGQPMVEPMVTATAVPITASAAISAVGITSETFGPSTLGMFGRLGWQTWRMSWRTMLVMLLATSLLGLPVLVMLLPLADHWNYSGWLLTLAVSLGGSALYASAIFHADQQHQQYRFLAEHAGRGRTVWFCRLSVWAAGLGLLLLVGLFGFGLYATVTVNEMASHLARVFVGNEYSSYRDLGYTAEQWAQFNRYTHGIGVASFGMFAGLAIGQFSSLNLRRSLVSALLAAVLATVFFGWSAVVIAWDLPWWSCLLPVPLGLFWAAWLRVPDWLTDRNNIRGWSKVLVAAGLPVVLVALLLPIMRLNQVPEQSAAQERIEVLLHQSSRGDTPEARRAGDRLLLLDPHIEPMKEARQNQDEHGPTEAKLSVYHGQQVAANRAIIDQAVEQMMSNQACRFPPLPMSRIWEQPTHQPSELAQLVIWAGDLATAEGQLDRALKHYLAALQIYAAMRVGQPSSFFYQTESGFSQVEGKIANWAGHSAQTSARIRKTIGQLKQISRLPLNSDSGKSDLAADPAWALSIDYQQVRDVLDEKRLPQTLRPIDLAYLANKLPFERVRAQRILTALTAKKLDTLELVRQRLDQHKLHLEYLVMKRRAAHTHSVAESRSKQAFQPRDWLQRSLRKDEYDARRLAYQTHRPPWSWLSTSYLLRGEYEGYEMFSPPGHLLSTFANGQVRQLGLQVQLALIACRLDQGLYPDDLQALVPEYLPYVPIDPFSGNRLTYEPAGLAYPLVDSSSSDKKEIAAQTPLIWSVGICDAVLQRVVRDPADGVVEAADQEDRVTTVAQSTYQYRFRPQETPRMYNALVFPLPK